MIDRLNGYDRNMVICFLFEQFHVLMCPSESKDLFVFLTVFSLCFIVVTEGVDSECNVIGINPSLLQKREILPFLCSFYRFVFSILSRIARCDSAFVFYNSGGLIVLNQMHSDEAQSSANSFNAKCFPSVRSAL